MSSIKTKQSVSEALEPSASIPSSSPFPGTADYAREWAAVCGELVGVRASPDGQPFPPLTDTRVNRVESIIQSQSHLKLALPQLAEETRLSVSRLCHLFKTHTGMAPARYLKQWRLERARRLLETTCLSVKEVCARVGLNDVSHFVRDFRRIYGHSPARYRKRCDV